MQITKTIFTKYKFSIVRNMSSISQCFVCQETNKCKTFFLDVTFEKDGSVDGLHESACEYCIRMLPIFIEKYNKNVYDSQIKKYLHISKNYTYFDVFKYIMQDKFSRKEHVYLLVEKNYDINLVCDCDLCVYTCYKHVAETTIIIAYPQCAPIIKFTLCEECLHIIYNMLFEMKENKPKDLKAAVQREIKNLYFMLKLKNLFRIQRILSDQCEKNMYKRVLLNLISLEVNDFKKE